jgi:hypothetical protein
MALESKYQKLLENVEKQTINDPGDGHSAVQAARYGPKSTPRAGKTEDHQNRDTSVPVNEDYLFDVNIETRELIPAYWLGPVYEGLITLSNHIRRYVLSLLTMPSSSARYLVCAGWVWTSTVRGKSRCTT